LRKAAHQEEKEYSVSKTTRKETSCFVFPRHDMDGTIGLKDNGINEAVSQGLAEFPWQGTV